MHATFWHLVQFVVVAMLCLLWPPGGLVPAYPMHPLEHGPHDVGEHGLARASFQSVVQFDKAL
jgi:hypothetical protein